MTSRHARDPRSWRVWVGRRGRKAPSLERLRDPGRRANRVLRALGEDELLAPLRGNASIRSVGPLGTDERPAIMGLRRPAGRMTRLQRLLSLKRDGWFHRHRHESHLVVVEPVPQPEIPAANAPHPPAPDGTRCRFVVRHAWKLIGGGESAHRPSNRIRSRCAAFQQWPGDARVPGAYADSPRHDSSSLPSSQRRNASDASGDRISPRSTDSSASRTSASSSGCGFHSCRAARRASGGMLKT